MRRFLPFLALLIFAASCGGEPPDVGATEQAASTSLTAGGAFYYYPQTTSPITEAWMKVMMPFPPISAHAESAFGGNFRITNQGDTYSENSLTFSFFRVEANPPTIPIAYYKCRILTQVVDTVGSFGHTTLSTVAQISVQQRDWCQFSWINGVAKIDQLGVDQGIIYSSTPVSVSWPLGTQPTWAHSPNVLFSLKYPISTYNSCFHDMPGYDDPALDDGHVWLAAEYSTGHYVTYPAAMLPNAATSCAMMTVNYADHDYVSWHTGG